MRRREFLDLMVKASVVASASARVKASDRAADRFYDLTRFGSGRILHFTDCHAQLLPIYFREPNVNLGVGDASGRLPHLVGQQLLATLPGIDARTRHALTYLDFAMGAKTYGRVGGFAHLKTLVDRLRAEAPSSLLLDGGDTWQGSGTALWTRGQDMVGACNRLGVDVMTGHWEFTYLEDEVLTNAEAFQGELVAQNIKATEDAMFEGIPLFDEDTGHIFKPYTVRSLGDKRVAVIGQAFPYTPIANPQRFIPNWTFGIQEAALADLVTQIRGSEQIDVVILLSHNGMDVDLKLASRVSGIDFILGGHTHDGIATPIEVENAGGRCVVTNAGSNGKFLGVLDLEFGQRGLTDYRYRLMPIFSNLLAPDPDMSRYIEEVRAPFLETLNTPLAMAEDVLYRRGNFNGTFDQLICDALCTELDAEFSLSPGFRWGTTILPGDTIRMEHLLDQTAMTYPETYVREMKGSEIKLILESVADNLFHNDPYLQQGGDMVRTGGLRYTLDPVKDMGHRISQLSDAKGQRIDADKSYRVAGWATVGRASEGPPVWEVVAQSLKRTPMAAIKQLETPSLLGVKDNAGIEDYAGLHL
ncbi:MAG: thiosulfohydrolase SoxB [Pseudomonadales bacterium]